MALSKMQRTIVTAIGVGVVVGIVVGGIGAYLGLSAGVRGGLTGAFTVVALQFMWRRMKRDQNPEA